LKNLHNKKQEFINNLANEFEISEKLKVLPFNQVMSNLFNQYQEDLNNEKVN
jgi:hypothetical protein